MRLYLVSFVFHGGMPEKRLLVGQSQYLLHRDLIFIPLKNQYPFIFQHAETLCESFPNILAPICA